MFFVGRVIRRAGIVAVVAGFLSACGGSHSTQPAIPGVPSATQPNAELRAAAGVTPATIAINSGGGAAGGFSADADYVTSGFSKASTTAAAIDTSGVSDPAPQAVYQSMRVAGTMTYTVPGLTPGAAYTVRLDFAEIYWTATKQRLFNASINNVSVLSNFDVFATAGARNKAVAESFSATADAHGSIAVTLTSVTDHAALSGIRLLPAGTAPTPPPTGFNDYATFGYDNQRAVFNPNSTALTPASLPRMHLAWQSSMGDYATQTQPILATEIPGHSGVLFVGGGSGRVAGYDALTGHVLWKTGTGQMSLACGGGTAQYGIGGTAAYDAATKSLYIVGNSNASANAPGASSLYRLDAATGQVQAKVNFTPSAVGLNDINFSHTAVTLRNGVAYVGTGSTCDIHSWRGRVVAVNVSSMTVAATFFTLWDPQNTRGAGAQPWGGGGVWGWGGVALGFSGEVLTGVGNADLSSSGKIKAPFISAPTEYSGYAETLLQLSPDLATVVAHAHPIPLSVYHGASDIDVQGTPLVFAPNGAGCSTMLALQGKSGELTLYVENRLANGFAAQYQLAPSSYKDSYLGQPAYSSATGLVYAPVAASTTPTLFRPGLIAIDPGCGNPSVAWHAAFGSDSSAIGIPRSVPAASAGGVVLAGSVNGSHGDLWAIDAATGALLNGGNPVLQTSGHLRTPATIDGDWVFVLDNSGNLYGLTTDPNFPAIQAKLGAADSRSREGWAAQRD